MDNFSGENIFIEYFKKTSSEKWSYWHFLRSNQAEIITLPPFSDEWTGLDGAWQRRFFYKAKEMPQWEDLNWKLPENSQLYSFWDHIIQSRKFDAIDSKIFSLGKRSVFNEEKEIRQDFLTQKKLKTNVDGKKKSQIYDNELFSRHNKEEMTPNSPPTRKYSTCLPQFSLPSSHQNIGNISDDEADFDSATSSIQVNCPIIINDIVELQLGSLPCEKSRWIINNLDISKKWHIFKGESLKLAKDNGLFFESHVQQILSLSHILLLKPKQHCPLMVKIFSAELLDTMHKDVMQRLTKCKTEFNAEVFLKIIPIVKCLQREEITRKNAVLKLQMLATDCAYGECAILQAIENIIQRVPTITLKSPIGEVELCTAYIDPVLSPIFGDPDRGVFLRWSNKEAPESKNRKSTGRAKQPDAIISDINQLSWGSSRGHGEVKAQEEINNLYSLCTDLVRVAVLNKDAIDFFNMNCILGFQVVGKSLIGQHITFYLTTLLYDGMYVMVEVGLLNVPMSLEELPAFLTSLDTLLVVSNAFWTNCAMSRPAAEMEPNKRSTLATPNFKELVGKSRDRYHSCEIRF
ncbi:hypothetical protein G9A89_002584 [Geosiphon pyriformis]|nr:hypothetical protein G9A89_002584 [Geosiphon pyriformis]